MSRESSEGRLGQELREGDSLGSGDFMPEVTITIITAGPFWRFCRCSEYTSSSPYGNHKWFSCWADVLYLCPLTSQIHSAICTYEIDHCVCTRITHWPLSPACLIKWQEIITRDGRVGEWEFPLLPRLCARGCVSPCVSLQHIF